MKRGLHVFRGAREATAREARELLGAADALWVSAADTSEDIRTPAQVRKLLGQTFDAVVLDLHAGFDPDLLGRCHGFVVAGGALVLRCNDGPLEGRMAARLERALGTVDPQPFRPRRDFVGSAEQDAVVAALATRFDARGSRVALLADRGRGKSVALGRAAEGRGALVTAAHPDQVAEVLRFAPDARYVDPVQLVRHPESTDLLLVDEAASLSVPLLRALLDAHPDATVAFASTTHGYEGHGRGFSLRFLPTVAGLERFTLSAPIRWDPDDPVEAFVHRVLLLDAAPPTLGSATSVRCETLDRDTLHGDRLRAVFGLLVAAHYRTTPTDLQRVLDAENLDVHALFEDDTVAAVCLTAREGGLSAETAAGLARGAFRVRGHALAETLAVHSGQPDCATWPLIRSVRTATHPDRRRRGYARQLVDHVHAAFAPAAFGTLFGATPALLAFRLAQGYRLVRLGVSRNSRSGEPSALMLRPVSPDAHTLVARLRAVLARDLPLQLELLESGALPLSSALRTAVLADLPAPASLTQADIREAVEAYARGPRPYDGAATALEAFVADSDLSGLEPDARTLVEGRVLERRSWAELAVRHDLSIPAVMRALRRAIATLPVDP